MGHVLCLRRPSLSQLMYRLGSTWVCLALLLIVKCECPKWCSQTLDLSASGSLSLSRGIVRDGGIGPVCFAGKIMPPLSRDDPVPWTVSNRELIPASCSCSGWRRFTTPTLCQNARQLYLHRRNSYTLFLNQYSLSEHYCQPPPR